MKGEKYHIFNSKYPVTIFYSTDTFLKISYIQTFDFSTFYTTIPHAKLKKKAFKRNYSQHILHLKW
jgi:hypothetical protein